MAEVARILHYAGILAVVWCLVDARDWRYAVAGTTAAAAGIAALALTSRLAPSLVGDDAIATTLKVDRLSFPFDYWNAVAAWSAMALAGLLAFAVAAPRLAARALCLALLPVCGLALYLSYSRAGLAAVLLAVAVVLACSRERWLGLAHVAVGAAGTGLAIAVTRSQPAIAHGDGSDGAAAVLAALAGAALLGVGAAHLTHRLELGRLRLPPVMARRLLALAAGVVLLGAVTVGRGAISDAWDDFRRLEPVEIQTAESDPAQRLTSLSGQRYEFWSAALDAFAEEPVKGIGAGSFEFWWSRNTQLPSFERDAHSLYLEQLAELGVPGLVLVLAFVFGLLLLALHAPPAAESERAAWAAALAMFAVFLFAAGVDWMWETTAVTALGLIAGALAAARPGPSPASFAPGARVAVVVIALIAFLAQLPGSRPPAWFATARPPSVRATAAGRSGWRRTPRTLSRGPPRPWCNWPSWPSGRGG